MQPTGHASGMKSAQSIAASPVELVSSAAPDDVPTDVGSVVEAEMDPDVASPALVEDDGLVSSAGAGPQAIPMTNNHAAPRRCDIVNM